MLSPGILLSTTGDGRAANAARPIDRRIVT